MAYFEFFIDIKAKFINITLTSILLNVSRGIFVDDPSWLHNSQMQYTDERFSQINVVMGSHSNEVRKISTKVAVDIVLNTAEYFSSISWHFSSVYFSKHFKYAICFIDNYTSRTHYLWFYDVTHIISQLAGTPLSSKTVWFNSSATTRHIYLLRIYYIPCYLHSIRETVIVHTYTH